MCHQYHRRDAHPSFPCGLRSALTLKAASGVQVSVEKTVSSRGVAAAARWPLGLYLSLVQSLRCRSAATCSLHTARGGHGRQARSRNRRPPGLRAASDMAAQKVVEVRGDPEPGKKNDAEPAGLLGSNHHVPWLTLCVWEVYSMS
jgi:hypothetical protein